MLLPFASWRRDAPAGRTAYHVDDSRAGAACWGNPDMTDVTPSRRFPPPWVVDRVPGGFVVRDANGQQLAWIYARATEAEARQAKVLTMDEARRIALGITKLPALLEHQDERD